MTFKTIYITGAPAAGKSSTLQRLYGATPNIQTWEYGARLTARLKQQGLELSGQDQLRAESARLATVRAIEELDEELLAFVDHNRREAHVIIDSHPVTKEDYGFRVTAFSAQQFASLRPDQIWFFYVPPEVTLDRLSADPAGRPLVTLEEARMHSVLQGSVAATYGIIAGAPVYLFDTDRPQSGLVDELRQRLLEE